MKRLIPLLVLPLAFGGCLFGGGDDEEKTEEQASYMDGSSSGPATASPTQAPAAGPSKALPWGALLLSGLTLVILIVHIARGRAHPDASGP